MSFSAPVEVTCAIVLQEGQVLAALRSAEMKTPLKWEFPGGKREAGESPEACIHRELKEELGIEVEVLERAPDFPFPLQAPHRIVLIPFVCRLQSGTPTPLEHESCNWYDTDGLKSLDWSQADLDVLAWWLLNQHRF